MNYNKVFAETNDIDRSLVILESKLENRTTQISTALTEHHGFLGYIPWVENNKTNFFYIWPSRNRNAHCRQSKIIEKKRNNNILFIPLAIRIKKTAILVCFLKKKAYLTIISHFLSCYGKQKVDDDFVFRKQLWKIITQLYYN